MDLGLSDKSAFVLGGSSGLGLAIAKCLAEEKVKVMIGGRKTARLDQALAEVCQINGSATALAIDLQDEVAVDAAEKELRKFGPDILVCNSGGPPAGSSTASDIGAWRQNFDSMVINQIRCIRAVLPAMIDRRWGRILVIGSSGVVAPIPNLVISNSLRAALVGFAKTLASEVAGSGVTVNTIVPGRIATPRVAQLDQAAAEREKTDVANRQAATASQRNSPASRRFWSVRGRAISPARLRASTVASSARCKAIESEGKNRRLDKQNTVDTLPNR